jgi:hypothetical protein
MSSLVANNVTMAAASSMRQCAKDNGITRRKGIDPKKAKIHFPIILPGNDAEAP